MQSNKHILCKHGRTRLRIDSRAADNKSGSCTTTLRKQFFPFIALRFLFLVKRDFYFVVAVVVMQKLP
jgi:hypothetical protein